MTPREFMSPHARRLALRAILQGDTCVRPATAYDPLSALAARELGYPLGILAGSVASLAVLGAPDIALLTLTELTEQVRRVSRACDLPIMVDGDHGYGNALNVRRTVEDMEAAGAAAVSIEDTLLPAAFGAGDKAQLISPSELGGKLRAAVAARSDPAFVVVGRTSALHARGLSDLLARQAVIQASGADALFIVGIRNAAELDAVAAAATLPLVLGSVVPGMRVADMAARKVRVCLQGHAAFYAGIAAMQASLAQQIQGGNPALQEGVVLAKRLAGEERHNQWAADYLAEGDGVPALK